MRALLCSLVLVAAQVLCSIALVAAQEVYRFDFSLDDQPLSGEFTSDQDLWQLAADFVAGRGWRCAPFRTVPFAVLPGRLGARGSFPSLTMHGCLKTIWLQSR